MVRLNIEAKADRDLVRSKLEVPNFCRINGAYFGAVLKLRPLSPLVWGGRSVISRLMGRVFLNTTYGELCKRSPFKLHRFDVIHL